MMGDVLLTGAEMRALEQAAFESGTVTGLELMERAGRGAVDAILAEWPEFATAPGRAVVLCGPGNNGGDGFVVARLLRQRGWTVEVFLAGDASKLPPDARTNFERWADLGEVTSLGKHDAPDRTATLVIDALFGIGLSRRVQGEVREVMTLYREVRSSAGPRYVALDCVSGLCADSGRILDNADAPRADLTVVFGAFKRGHFLAEGPDISGKVALVDIGLEPYIERLDPLSSEIVWTAERASDRALSSPPLLKQAGHKFDHGHALVLSGGVGRGGAARLAARGALRIGAGLVTLGCPPSALLENGCHLNAIMLRAVADEDSLAGMLTDKRITALCLGPGLGLGEREAGLVAAALSSGLPIVLDADALTLVAGSEALRAALHPGCILTPHAGEFARLCPDLAEKLATVPTVGPAYSKVDATRDAAARLGCTVLFKGPDTVIATAEGRACVHAAAYDRAAPWLATAGSGDVLAGFITGLLGRGFSALDASETAAYLHAEAARAFGPGLIAEDLPEMLPKVLSLMQ